MVEPPKNTKWGSLKSLENLLATKVDVEEARRIMGPLFGIYEIRQADAHLAGKELDDSLNLVGVNQKEPYVFQGRQLLHACVTSIYRVYKILENWNNKEIQGSNP